MLRWLIILLLLVVGVGFNVAGPYVSIGPSRPLASEPIRVFVLGITLMVSAALAVSAINRRKRLKAEKRELSAGVAFRATWRMVGLLSAPIALLAGMSIWVIESAYRDISHLTGEMTRTLDELSELGEVQRGAMLSDPASTAELLTQVYGFTQGFEGETNLPLLDPETDRAYLNEHYEVMVSNHLRPQLMQRLEQQITSNLGQPAALYQALKVYLMLGQAGPMDADYVLSWIEGDLVERFPGTYNQELRERLTRHTQTLVKSERWNEYPVRSDLVAEARKQFSFMPASELLYYRIMSDPLVNNLESWRVTEAGGPATARVFMRASGKPLGEGIPGIFTREGFNDVFLRLALASANLMQSEAWVRGRSVAEPPGDAEAAKLTREVLDLYSKDFVEQWDSLLDDLTVIPTESYTQLVELFEIVSSEDSPITNVLSEAARQTLLTAQDERPVVEDILAMTDRSLSRLSLLVEKANKLSVTGAAPDALGAEIEERFIWLHGLFKDVTSEIVKYQRRMSEVLFAMTRTAPGNAPSAELEDAVDTLRRSARDLPPVLANWTLQLLGNFERQSSETVRMTLNTRWQSDILPFCLQATAGRYPFDREAEQDIPLADFARLFAPGGMINSYFNEFLAPYVDRGARQWRWRNDLGLSDAALAEFRKAAEIRNSFFASGRLEVRFELSMQTLDPASEDITIRLGDDWYEYSGVSQTAQSFSWPWPSGGAGLETDVDGRPLRVSFEGDWAFFRLLDRLETRGPPMLPQVLYSVPNLYMNVIEISVPQAISPFANPALRDFTCPRVL